ncbi:hypothetical protein FRC04_007133 [Tulasnella sp. 424]|nr:hypothetical protein FRC04_007133 [Tulasnella sp. 424]KAG8959948.1 hypothetical protein FRC05_007147 [Tulasnella sp. 425]
MPTTRKKADTTPSTSQATAKDKGDANAIPDTIDPPALPQPQNNRPKRSTTKKTGKGEHPAGKPQPEPTSRKRPAKEVDNQSSDYAPEPEVIPEAQPATKKLKTKNSKGFKAQADSVTTASVKKSTKKKGTTNGLGGQAAKENVPPIPATTTSKSKKTTAAERREQQLSAADQEALEQRIKELEAENASQRRAVERLQRTNIRLDHRATRLASTAADSKIDQVISEPKAAKYNLRKEMGLEKDSNTYLRIQRTVRDLSRRVLNFEQSWKNQDPIVIGDLFRAAAEKEPFLRRFRLNWATAKLSQMYLRNNRSYFANIDIPESGVAKRRAKRAKKKDDEVDLPPPDLSKKKKSTKKKSTPASSKEGSSDSSTSAAPEPGSSSSTMSKRQTGTVKASKHPNGSGKNSMDAGEPKGRGNDDDGDEEEEEGESGEKSVDDDDETGGSDSGGDGDEGSSEEDGDVMMGDGEDGPSSDGCGDE